MAKSHEYYMKLALNAALEGINKGQTPFGCCIVKKGEILALNHNIVWQTTDITAHAEITAIREACIKANSIDLSGTVLYSTCEPCPMCFTAIHWAKIDELYFGAAIEDAANAGFNELAITNKDIKEKGNLEIKINHGILKDECRDLFRIWKEKVNKPY